MEKPRVQVWITAHDRPEMAAEAVESALALDYPDFEVLLSDNSSNGDDRIERKFGGAQRKGLRYVRRRPCMVSSDHTAAVISDTKAQYFMAFHDDDILNPDFLKQTMDVALSMPACAAVGSNYGIMDNGVRTVHAGMPPSKAVTVWRDHRALLDYMAKRSFHLEPGCFSMIGGQLYRREKVGRLYPMESWGGKYNDMAFMAEVCRRGPVAWVMEPLWWTRHHTGQDGFSYALDDALLFLEYYRAAMGLRPTDQAVQDLRASMFSIWRDNAVKLSLARKCRLAVGQAVAERGTVVLFPCGHHTRWLLDVLGDSAPKQSIVISDDNEQAFVGLHKRGCRCMLGPEAAGLRGAAVLLSSDNKAISAGLKARMTALFNDRWRSIYSLLPGDGLFERELASLLNHGSRMPA